MSKMMAVAFPIVPGKFEQWKEFIHRINHDNKDEFRNARKSAGVRERTYLQTLPDSHLVIVTLEGEDPMGAFQKMMSQTDDFTRWFISQASEVHGFDLGGQQPGPMPELVADSEG
jgi:hypothetical protein